MSIRTFSKVPKPGVQGFPAGACGLPNPGVPNSFFFLSPPQAASKRRKRCFWGTPNPGRRLPPSALPLAKQVKRAFHAPEKFGMTHRELSMSG